LKIAFVHSWLNQYGGAERVLEAAHELFPDAPVYTSIYDPAALPASYRTWDIRTSFMQHWPAVHRRHQFYLPFYPFAFASFDLRGYDLLLSIPSAFAHGVVKPDRARHICYCLTPARFLWSYRAYVENEAVGRGARAVLPFFILPLRKWDRHVAARVDTFIAISHVVQDRIAHYYRRNSTIIYPPVYTEHFQPVATSEVGDYFLIVSRLAPYKRVDLAVQALTQVGLPLVIAGDGRDRARLEKMAGPNVRFVGRVSDAARRDLMARCRAFIFPGEEDFGIAPLEANASGRPVIAYGRGGTLDTIVEGTNGLLFHEPAAAALADCVRTFDPAQFDPHRIRAHAEQFDVRLFQQRLCGQLVD